MKKTQSATIGAILAAGLLIRPASQITTSIPVTDRSGASAAEKAGKAVRGEKEGPWIASCRYWSPAREYQSSSEEKTASVSLTVKGSDFSVATQASSDLDDTDEECANLRLSKENRTTPSDLETTARFRTASANISRWGLPTTPLLSGLSPEVHAIIAAVPDPNHSHLALQFDRDVDALVQAAGDNNYVPSYYWLPWKHHSGLLRADESTSTEGVDERSDSDRQPGLIIFKYVPPPALQSDPSYPWSSYSKVIYVFLVGQTPTLGMDGAQLKRAFEYEANLAENAQLASLASKVHYSISFSMKGNNRLDIIGPTASGAAASMREGVEKGRERLEAVTRSPLDVVVAGTTSTGLAADLLDWAPGGRSIKYYSFGDDSSFESDQFTRLLAGAKYRNVQAAILIEDSTAFGTAYGNAATKRATVSSGARKDLANTFLYVRFPREISLLRNAHADTGFGSESQSDSTPSPFLHLSLKDPGSGGSVPQFSAEHTPLSQEAQLMAIGRQLINNRVKFITIIASDVLDELFLAQFLHRTCPDARLLFLGSSDLFFERDTENAPFIGSITLTPYPLQNLTTSLGLGGPVRAFSDSNSESYYNATSFILSNSGDPHLANYKNPMDPDQSLHASLWATVVGRDGYYPLAIVNECGSDREEILPSIHGSVDDTSKCFPPSLSPRASEQKQPSLFEKLKMLFAFSDGHYDKRPFRYPAFSWYVLCISLTVLCIVHSFAVSFPNYWSSLTRDLAIPQGDKRHLRAVYIHNGTVMLFCMAFVTAYPLFPTFRVIHPNWPAASYSLITIFAATTAFVLTLRKTRNYLQWHDVSIHIDPRASGLQKLRTKFDKNLPWFFNRLGSLTLLIVVVTWVYICHTEFAHGSHNYVGLFFSYRCLHPGSGVSPLVPVLLILLGWYIWAVFQTLRMRFSTRNRPQLPGKLQENGQIQLYVSDLDLAQKSGNTDGFLFDNITCLLITRTCLKRLMNRPKLWLAPALLFFYISMFYLVAFRIRIESLDRLLWQPGDMPTAYELLLSFLLYPLIMTAVAGWLRFILVWGSLKHGLLDKLEQSPIRYAFSRLKGTGWMAMMRQGGLTEQWQDMSRSTESIHQMCHDHDLLTKLKGTPFEKRIQEIKKNLDAEIDALRMEFAVEDQDTDQMRLYFEDDPTFQPGKLSGIRPVQANEEWSASNPPPSLTKNGNPDPQRGLNHMYNIEKHYASFCEALLDGVLLEYWEKTRTGLVASDEIEELPIRVRRLTEDESAERSHAPLQLHTSSAGREPMFVQVAEEFLAIRYLSLIRAVLMNVRYLIMFVSAVFVLTIVAWNSYPFQPRQWVNEGFTSLLILFGAGIIWVFAQIHRDPILSRITDTDANELGLDFYLRVALFGAAPVLTWLAYQFPEVGGSLLRLVQPSLEVLK